METNVNAAAEFFGLEEGLFSKDGDDEASLTPPPVLSAVDPASTQDFDPYKGRRLVVYDSDSDDGGGDDHKEALASGDDKGTRESYANAKKEKKEKKAEKQDKDTDEDEGDGLQGKATEERRMVVKEAKKNWVRTADSDDDDDGAHAVSGTKRKRSLP